MDERGYVRFVGRLKEMIVRGGENIYPREIEDVLFEHPAVADVAVVGVPDARYGEEVAAFIRLHGEVTEDELREYTRARLAPFKCPRHWRIVDEFPLTGSGKVQKFALTELFTSSD
jgi:fatty-acyl-CoA synthase